MPAPVSVRALLISFSALTQRSKAQTEIRTKNVGGEKGDAGRIPFFRQMVAEVSLGAGVRSAVCSALAAARL
jgi:hypothetical protein